MIVQQTRSITARIVGVMARPFAGFGLVREIIGRYSRRTPVPKTSPTVDGTRADYAWYDRFRRGMEKDWELASPFAMPIVNTIVSWTLGDLFSVVHEDNDDLAADLNRFVSDNKDTILAWMSDALALGDGFMLVEPLGKLVRLSPDTVEIDVAADDVTRIERLVISTILDEENSIIDTWTPYTRSITRKINGTELEPELYENTLGIVPLVHLAWGRTANEIYGHPVYEQLLQVFSRYHDLLSSTLRGVELMGTPLPVAKGLENVKRAIEQNATGTATIRTGDGRAVTRTEVDWEQLRSQMLWLEGGADFDFKAPAPFASDSRSMLKLLFLIIIESVSIPEFVFGPAIASSKASADAQMPAFTRVVEYWRLQIEAPILLLLEIWLANEAQFTLPTPSILPAMPVIPTSPDEPERSVIVPENEPRPFRIEWTPLTDDTEVLIEKLKLADMVGALSPAEILRLLDLVEDPAKAVEEAQAAAKDRADRFDLALAEDLDEPQPDDDDDDDDDD